MALLGHTCSAHITILILSNICVHVYVHIYDCTSTEGSAHMTIHILSNVCVHVYVHIYVYMTLLGHTCSAHVTILILSNIHIHVYVHIYV